MAKTMSSSGTRFSFCFFFSIARSSFPIIRLPLIVWVVFVATSFILLTVASSTLCNRGGWKNFWNGGKGGSGGEGGGKLLTLSFKKFPMFGSGHCPVWSGKLKQDGDGGDGKKIFPSLLLLLLLLSSPLLKNSLPSSSLLSLYLSSKSLMSGALS